MEFEQLDDTIFTALVEALDKPELIDKVGPLIDEFERLIEKESENQELMDLYIDKGISAEQATEIFDAEDGSMNTFYYRKVHELLHNGVPNMAGYETAKTMAPSALLTAAGVTVMLNYQEYYKNACQFAYSFDQLLDVYPQFHEGFGNQDGDEPFTSFVRYPCGHIEPKSTGYRCPICHDGAGEVLPLPLE